MGAAVSATAATPASMKAGAVANAEARVVSVANDVEAVKADVRVSAVEALETEAVKVPTTIKKAESTGTAKPFYYLPTGAFYPGFILDHTAASSSLSGASSMYVSCMTPFDVVAVPYSTDGYQGSVSYAWNYQINDWTGSAYEALDKTATTRTINMPALYPVHKITVAAPSLAVNGGTPYAAADQLFIGGQVAYNFNDIGIHSMGLSACNLDWFTNDRAAIPENPDSLTFARFSDVSCGETMFYYNTKIEGLVNVIKKPAAPFGIKRVIFRGAVQAFVSDAIKVDIYEKITEPAEEEGYVNIKIGKRIGGGVLPKSDVPVNTTSIIQVAIPIVQEMGELSTPSFVNIDTDVFVVLSGWDNSKGDNVTIFSVLGAEATPHQLSLESYFMDRIYTTLDEADPENPKRKKVDWNAPRGLTLTPTNLGGVLYSNGAGSPMLFMRSFDMFYDGYNSYLNIEDRGEGYYNFVAPTAGGSKNFAFIPYDNLQGDEDSDAETVRFSGEGCDDWILVTPNEYNETTGEQTITLEVDPLPAGVAGRKGEVIVEICGAKQVITVEQGDNSGIDSVADDAAATISSAYYDLAGRQLSAEPENGLFIRKDVKADGSVKAVKVVK